MIPQDLYVKELSKVCLHGRDIKNPYTGEHMYVPCGVCPTCLMKKSSMRSIRCQVQQTLSDYCFFGTLTYNTTSVPKAKITRLSPDGETYFFHSLPRDIKGLARGCDDDITFTFKAKDSYMKVFMEQASLNINGRYPYLSDCFSYLNRKDSQLFMKRLRYYCKQILGNYEKIHMFIVGEYTPKHFRPHFHFLLFFDSSRLAKSIRKIVSKSWSFGRVDISAARKDASSYVASYVNSDARLPYFFKESNAVRPFSRFSNGFGRDLFLSSSAPLFDGKADEESFFEFVDGVPFVVNGNLLSVRPWRSVVDSCFFRYACNASLSVNELCHIVESVCFTRERYLRETGDISLMGFSRHLYNILYDGVPYNVRCSIYESDSLLADLLYYARTECLHFSDSVHKEKFIGQIYRITRLVYAFLRGYKVKVKEVLTCDGFARSRFIRLLEQSQRFFRFADYAYLKRSLQFIEDSEDDILDMYLMPRRSVLDEFSSSHPLVNNVNSYLKFRLDASIKHREVNDLNIKFVSYGEIKS